MKDLLGRDKVEMAIERLKEFEPPEGYYLAFSGGKDSIVIKDLAIKSGVKFESYFNNTTIEHPALYKYIRKYHPDVIWNKPKKPFLHRMIEKGTPPQRNKRWCCAEYKENVGSGRFVVTGVRWAESRNRKNRRMVETCYKDKTKHYLNLIIDWNDEEVWSYIRKNELPYCELYNQHFKRLGCLGCPMSYNAKRELDMYPRYKRAFIRAFDAMLAKRIADGKPTTFTTGLQWFNWWIDKKGWAKQDEEQMVLFE